MRRTVIGLLLAVMMVIVVGCSAVESIPSNEVIERESDAVSEISSEPLEETSAVGEVEVTGGKISGALSENGVMSYKGIPFAASTEGENRWKAPQSVTPWEGTKACTEYGPIAMQNEATTYGGAAPWTAEYLDLDKTYQNGQMSEDCLNLNVWTTVQEGDSQPVIVYIHGGGNNSGSGTCEIYTGEDIAQKGVVYVSINYRVGIFGFLAYKDSTGEEVGGNFGIMDQITALEWVRDNIEKFGGDPTNVTVAGQSAGAGNVQTLIASPVAAGLFGKAIIMSGNSVGRSVVTKEALQDEASKSLSSYTIADLRNMSSDEVQELTRTYNPTIACIDGEIVTQSITDAYSSGNYNNVDVMIGMVTGDASLFSVLDLPDNDGNPFTPVTSVTSADYEQCVSDTFGEAADDCLALYPADTNSDEAIGIASQVNFDGLVSATYRAAQLKDAGDSDHHTYVYNFSRVLPDTEERMKEHGAFHTGDVGYWLNHFTTSYPRDWTETDYDLGDIMSSYVVNFAADGDPNGTDSNGNALPAWVAANDTPGISYLDFGDTVEWVQMDEDKNTLWQAFNDQRFR